MDVQKDRSNRTTHLLIISFIIFLFVCTGGFLFLGYYTNSSSEAAIGKVGDTYMASIREQISSHFQTLINLKLEQEETAMKVAAENSSNDDELSKELIYYMRARNFTHLALCSETGNMEMLYGDQIKLADPEPFFESLKRGERKVALGIDKSGGEVILFGTSAAYPMKNGEKSIAVAAAIPIDYVSTIIDASSDNTMLYYHILLKDGSLVASDLRAGYDNYFDSVYERFSGDGTDDLDGYVKDLSYAMENKKDYSGIMHFQGSRQQVYCTSLPYSEWNLLIILPVSVLNRTVEDLNRSTTIATTLIFAVIFVFLMFLFFGYYRMTCRQLKDLDEARQEAVRATKAKSEFLSNMSHDIRTPMNAIVGMTAIARAHIDDMDQVQNCLKKISISGKHLLGLINDVLDMSKIESGKMTLTVERVSLQEVFDGVVGIIQPQVRAKEQNFNVHLDNVVDENVYCDNVRLNQVLLNLLSNAVKYTQEGGTIQMSLYQDKTAPPKGDNYVRTHVIVKDNGMGMTPEFLEHLFDSYARADSSKVQKIEGTGLGMVITKYIVDAMEGTLNVESEIDKGTEFHIILDLERADEQEVDMHLPAWKMLVIDDDETLCRTAVDTLASIGVQADWTMSGLMALDMVRKHHEKQDDYQIVLLDWKLPDMDGLIASKQIRKIIGDDVKVILISAYDWSEFETGAREAGVNGFIAKPLFKSTLYYGLRKFMGITDEQEEIGAGIDLSGRLVLVAEDNEINWEILEQLLSDVGMELEWAENGKICLEKFSRSEYGRYDAILMDVRMPVMNGYEATEAIRALEREDAKNIPIIAMTADAFSEDIQKCLESGMNAHAAKPINIEEVVSLLKKYIT